jgi:hypothetical protein
MHAVKHAYAYAYAYTQREGKKRKKKEKKQTFKRKGQRQRDDTVTHLACGGRWANLPRYLPKEGRAGDIGGRGGE